MAPPSQKKRRVDEGIRGKTSRPKKRFRKQYDYRSSEDEDEDESNSDVEQDFKPVSLEDSDGEEAGDEEGLPQAIEIPTSHTEAQNPEKKAQQPESHSEDDDSEQDRQSDEDGSGDQDSEDNDDDDELNNGTTRKKPTSKRNDPDAFSTSISKLLSTKLSQSVRQDPVLSRSREAHEKGSALANDRLERKVKAKQRAEKKQALEKGRVTDVLGLASGTAGEVAEDEKRLRKIAQRGVVKLFNAVRAAQVRAEQAAKEEQKKGTVGMGKREDKAKEMSKDAFLNMINGQKKTVT